MSPEYALSQLPDEFRFLAQDTNEPSTWFGFSNQPYYGPGLVQRGGLKRAIQGFVYYAGEPRDSMVARETLVLDLFQYIRGLSETPQNAKLKRMATKAFGEQFRADQTMEYPRL